MRSHVESNVAKAARHRLTFGPNGCRIWALLLACIVSTGAHGCWTDAAERYGVAVELLYAVARVESNVDPGALNTSHLRRTGSYDVGLMQINSSHLRTLARHGINEASLRDPCTNLMVGAWLLADSFTRHGVTWNAVGAYNASCSQLRGSSCDQARSRYAWRVYRAMHPSERVNLLSTGVARGYR
jgi:soluble lytic murein transglycosylase-like protein